MEKTIISVIQEAVDDIVKEEGYKVNYGREFKVSILQDDYDSTMKSFKTEKIILTVLCGDLNFSRVLFPKNSKDSKFGLNSLKEDVRYLFNTTT